MDLEIYKPKHRSRVYLGNHCNYCFQIARNMRMCACCQAVSYCSEQHQKKDLPFHNPTCEALIEIKKQVKYPKKVNFDNLSIYKENLMRALVQYRGLLGPEYLTEYEKQICYFPLECSFCFKSKPEYHCKHCETATYCSPKHRKLDKKNHSEHCSSLKFFKVFASLGYENGFILEKYISIEYKPIPKFIKQIPENSMVLVKYIQNQIKYTDDEEEFVSLILFVEPYIPAACIIYVMETIGAIKRRELQGLQKIPNNKTNKSVNTLSIHLIMADDYELSFHWSKIAQFLTDWLYNIKNIEIVLTGPKLEDCFVPSFEKSEKYDIMVHSKSYHELEDLPQPDIIVMFESSRIFHYKNEIFWSPAYQEYLFRYKNTPVVFFNSSEQVLNKVFDIFSGIRDVKCLKSAEDNCMGGSNASRVWFDKKNLGINMKNSKFSVFTKC